MSQIPKLVRALSTWTLGTVLLLVVCALSVNQAIITAAVALAAGTLVSSIVAFKLKRDTLALGFSAAPGVVVVGLVVMLLLLA